VKSASLSYGNFPPMLGGKLRITMLVSFFLENSLHERQRVRAGVFRVKKFEARRLRKYDGGGGR